MQGNDLKRSVEVLSRRSALRAKCQRPQNAISRREVASYAWLPTSLRPLDLLRHVLGHKEISPHAPNTLRPSPSYRTASILDFLTAQFTVVGMKFLCVDVAIEYSLRIAMNENSPED